MIRKWQGKMLVFSGVFAYNGSAPAFMFLPLRFRVVRA